MVIMNNEVIKTQIWCLVMILVFALVEEVASLNGPHVCMVQQKYNITKRVKYRAPMSVRTYEWCFSMPPRCSKWKTEMRELTKLETDERIAEVAVCCPGYKMKDVSCVPICPNGKTGHHCSEDCPPNKWGPNCVNECKECGDHGTCSPINGECSCQEGWQGESCDDRMTTLREELLIKPATKNTTPLTPAFSSTTLLETVRSKFDTALSSQVNLSSNNVVVETTLQTTAMPTTPSTVATLPIINSTVEETSKITIPKIISTEAASTTPLTSTMEVKASEVLTTIKLPPKKPAAATTTSTTTTEIPEETTILTTKPTTITTSPLPTTLRTTESPSSETTTKKLVTNPIYNITNLPERKIAKDIFVEVKTIPISKIRIQTTQATIEPKIYYNITNIPIMYTYPTTTEREVTKRPDATIRYFPTTVKFKPKEIWIRPAQKGDSIEAKKTDLQRHKVHTTNTTPKTIIVSIIPTSVSYTTFKKIALTTASSPSQKTSIEIRNITEVTKAMATTTTTPIKSRITKLSTKFEHVHKVTKPTFHSKELSKTSNGTNSMKNLTFLFTTVSPTNAIKTHNVTKERVTMHPVVKIVTAKPRNVTIVTVKTTTKIPKTALDFETNVTKNKILTTEMPEDEETFHILTEPEHITAVMEGKEKERTSVDLISVISIAGGVMMAVITVAVVIVMIERCRRPRYEDVRKMNDIHMQVMIDNNDVPPPYVRSIFHTPLPDPPTSDKCHYQPISTLDRNLKQFMRPVVVQTISPIMLENFREILECHYDHLPRRTHICEVNQRHCSVPPSIDEVNELTCLRPCSVADSTIDALKCEAKLDVIDHTTSEPLYAEIPCWRPPSEHAVEVMNLNGEAVTEL